MTQRDYVVKSVVKALDILEMLDQEKELGISELAEKLQLDKSTVHRLVTTLKLQGYVTQNQTNQKYANSIKLFEMGNRMIEGMGFRRQCQPYLEELAMRTHETVNLAIQDGHEIIYIDKIESRATIKVDLGIGKRLPMYCTGLGKAMLAWLPEEELDQLYGETVFKPYTPKTLTTLQDLKESLAVIRQQGYSLDDEEYVVGLMCVAAPIWNHQGRPIAAISVAVPEYRFQEGLVTTDYGEVVKEISEKISRELGCRQENN
ncbi:IclR family transcriptional regulator [Anoxynatronum buryatiense]|uniref:Glycerol operon regulatory protein n=1 Tax=Anoxynatronum buryatiense TaxID=489973 RepID=A0AA45WWT7_9CLOT|nr:IclR family transcriptional regulator [Anoxynatronum buryatiense]SMP59948.1 transcriptional regulator, IclR family [Anoxynatronum buryatiense]